MDPTSPSLLAAIAQVLLVGVLAFASAAALTSHMRYRALLRKVTEDEIRGTGEGQALRLQIAEFLRVHRRDRASFVVLLVELDRAQDWTERYGAEAVEAVVQAVDECLRNDLRFTDRSVAHGTGGRAYLLRCARGAAERVARRLLDHAKGLSHVLPEGPVLTPGLIVGMASFPENGPRVHDVYGRARAGLEAARAAPGAPAFAPGSAVSAAEAPVEHPRGLLDELTGVLREDRLSSSMHKYVANVRRDGAPASVLCLDIDHLARYNAQYGEAVGHELLKGVSRLLQRSVREGDLIGRCEGDQFVITMPADSAQALRIGQRLVAEVRRTSFSAAGLALRLTVSVGAAGHPDVMGSARHLFEAAEAAARKAHEQGGGRCIAFDSPRAEPPARHERADVI